MVLPVATKCDELVLTLVYAFRNVANWVTKILAAQFLKNIAVPYRTPISDINFHRASCSTGSF